MAAATIVAVGTNGWVDPGRGMYVGPVASTETLLANGTAVANRLKYTTSMLYASAVGNTNTHASGITSIKGVFVMSSDVDAVNAPAVSWDTAGVLTFAMGAGSWTGWILLVLDDPTAQFGKPSL